jgi:hypothetical protein
LYGRAYKDIDFKISMIEKAFLGIIEFTEVNCSEFNTNIGTKWYMVFIILG